MTRPPLLAMAVLTACGPAPEPVDLRDPPVLLEVPEVSQEVLSAGVQDALDLALTVNLRAVWPEHVATLDLVTPGCPDLFAGTPDVQNPEVGDGGLSWSDLCGAPGGRRFAGWSWWDNHLSVDGDPTTAIGATTQASRTLAANGVVSVDGDVLLDLDGQASDALLQVDAVGTQTWSYSAYFNGSASGSLLTALAPGGVRANLFSRTAGGDADTLEVRGDVYLFEDRLQGTFDSVTLDLLWAAPGSTPPNGCAEEPAGWIGVRDENAYWYELVFQPRYDDVTDNPYEDGALNRCDGCANVYIRGVRQPQDLCPDLSFVWDGALSPPAPEDFVYDVRTLLGGR